MNTFTTMPSSPVSFDATHLTVADFDAPISHFNQLMTALPTTDSVYHNGVNSPRHEPYPSTKSQQPRRRRKREAIDIPDEIVGQYDPKEVKKIKNRIAAARLRERSQQKIRDLEAEVMALRKRNAMLESLAVNCSHCSTVVPAAIAAPTVVVPCSPPHSAPCSPAPSVQSPSTQSECAAMTHEEVMGEFENDLLHQLLWQSEEMNMMHMQL